MEEFDINHFVREYAAGKSVLQLHKESGLGTHVIKSRLMEAGVQLRSRADSIRRPEIPDLHQIAERYRNGEFVSKLAAEYGVGNGMLTNQLRRAGVVLRPFSEAIRLLRSKPLSDTAKIEIVRRYKAGEPISSLSGAFGLSPGQTVCKSGRPSGIKKVLLDAGVLLRDSSEVMEQRWSEITDPEERRRVMRKAWLGGAGRRRQDLLNIAPEEFVLFDFLRAEGYAVVQQRPVDMYNLDLSLEGCRIAVELERGPAFAPSVRTKTTARVKHLLDSRWCVLHVIIGRRTLDCRAVTDQLNALLDLSGRDESVFGQYGVIGCKGESLSSPRYDLDTLPRIPGF